MSDLEPTFPEVLIEVATSVEGTRPVGGWLIYFGLGFSLGGLYFVSRVIHFHKVSFVVGVYLLLGLTRLVAGLAILFKSRLVRYFVPALLTTQFFYASFQVFVAIHRANRTGVAWSGLVGQELSNAAFNICLVVIMFFYFRTSLRVRDTFGKNF